MSEHKPITTLIGISAIVLGISLSNFIDSKKNLEQSVQPNTIEVPDATDVDTPIHYSQLIDSNYFEAQKDSSYLTQ
jgi:hypothetical protein